VIAPAFSKDSRRQYLWRLREERFDVLIVGGGINGAGIARDLALRGLRVALVERRHFASGTSSRNSQLIHGGLRYLKYLEIGLVREALRERSTLLEIAPHLVKPQPFLLPFEGRTQELFYGVGLLLYNLLARRYRIGATEFLSRAAVRDLEPRLEPAGLTAGAIFYDCKVNSARFVLENVFDAARAGAVTVNYVAAESLQAGGAVICDVFTGDRIPVRARKVVDARGAWQEGGLRLVRGSHIVLPRLTSSNCAIAYFEPHGRIVFVIPWGERDDLSLVGTTDVDHASGPDSVAIAPEEEAYLMGMARRLFPSMSGEQPVAAFSSLRPLLAAKGGSPAAATREHRIWNSPSGVLRVAGGKYTTYRAMSEEAGDLVAREIAPELARKSVTSRTPLGGDSLRYKGMVPEERVCRAVTEEMAQRLIDVLFVSTYWGYQRRWTPAELRPLARVMGNELGWNQLRTEEELELASRLVC
jgi:glycerol-3-phosphate dehydrogenase